MNAITFFGCLVLAIAIVLSLQACQQARTCRAIGVSVPRCFAVPERS